MARRRSLIGLTERSEFGANGAHVLNEDDAVVSTALGHPCCPAAWPELAVSGTSASETSNHESGRSFRFGGDVGLRPIVLKKSIFR